MFSGLRALIRKVFCKSPSAGYSRIDGEKPSDTQGWKDSDVSEKKDVVLEQDPRRVLNLQVGHKSCVPTALIRKIIDMYFRINHAQQLKVEQVVEHLGHNFDHLFDSLRSDTNLFNFLHPDSSRKGSLMEVSGLGYGDHSRFAALMQSVDKNRKMGSFNLYLKVSCILAEDKYAKKCRKNPYTVELLRQAAMKYDMKQATQHAARGGAALIHILPETARLDLLQQWKGLFEIAGESSPRPDICAAHTHKLRASQGYEIDSAILVRWYSREVLHRGTAKA